MVEVVKTLQELNASWKKNGHYNMKCRWCACAPEVHDRVVGVNNSFLGDTRIMDNDDANGWLPAVIKFEIQVLILLLMNTCWIFYSLSLLNWNL
jgi:5'-AMP-activated protein kinase, catalytic alpha subunit